VDRRSRSPAARSPARSRRTPARPAPSLSSSSDATNGGPAVLDVDVARLNSLPPAEVSPTAPSRHVTRDRAGAAGVCEEPPPWRLVAGIVAAAGFTAATTGPCLGIVLLACAVRLGPLHWLLGHLPAVRSRDDYSNRHYRVTQSMWLASFCCGIYTLIPEEKKVELAGWKMNLVTMETSMASGIAATYGYSVAGGIPGGLLAEYVMSSMGRCTVAELTPWLGRVVAKATASFALFLVMGSFMEFFAICAYAFAHQAEPKPPPEKWHAH